MTKRTSFRLEFAVVVVALLFSCTTSRATTNYISIKDSAYNPNQLAINAGDTVVWTQDDNTEHSVTSSDALFDSGTLAPEDVYSRTFNEVGTFPYYCVFHGAGNMAGVIVVSEPAENTPPDQPANVFPADNATNLPVAVQLRGSSFSDSDPADFHGASQWIVRYANNGAIAVDSGPVTSGTLTNYNPIGLTEGTTFEWQVRYRDGRGAWSAYSTPTRFTTLVSFNQQGSGLLGSYNNVIDFSSPLIVVTNASIDFDWGKTRPNRRITADNFAVRWEGSLLPQFTESYQIEFQFRGHGRVWVNNVLLIDEWSGCSFGQARRAPVSLIAGQLAAVRVEYVADPLGALAVLKWSSPNVPYQVIPTVRLFPQAP